MILPPLSSLRAFEAVARRLSFTRAADELHVTPGAISQQVRSFELHLGEKLFERTKRSVALTDAGARLLPDIQAGLEVLSRAINSSVAPSFASKWLMPRLSDFSESYPDIDLPGDREGEVRPPSGNP